MQAITDSSKSVYECLRGTPTVFHKKPRNGVELVKQLALRRFPARWGWRSGWGADTVQLTPTSAGNSDMLQAASASFVSDTKQERMPIPERVTHT